MKVEKPRVALTLDNKAEITFICDRAIIDTLETITTDFIDLSIKEYRESRSLSQNGYMWTLLDKIASKLNDKPENIYRSFIRDYGVKDYICITNEALSRFCQLWSNKGLGWFCDILRQGKIDGTTTVVCYYGSSEYNVLEMIHLIEPIIEEAEKLGIPTLTMDNFKKLRNDVDKKKETS